MSAMPNAKRIAIFMEMMDFLTVSVMPSIVERSDRYQNYNGE
jgi:hypothetical protein